MEKTVLAIVGIRNVQSDSWHHVPQLPLATFAHGCNVPTNQQRSSSAMPSFNAACNANAALLTTYRPVALFVGGTSGIGQAMAERFAHHTQGLKLLVFSLPIYVKYVH